MEPVDSTNNEFPFILITGRIASHFNTRTRTGRTPKLRDQEPICYIEINPEDASRLNVKGGKEVEITSRRGTICLPARFTDNLLEGTVFIPIHYGHALGNGEEKLANILTHAEYDIHSKQPEFKYTAVNITRTASS